MAVHWGGRGPGHLSRSMGGRSWNDFTAATGFVESPDNTFTRNSADSWTPRVTSNAAFTGAVQMEGARISGNDIAFGLDSNRAVTLPYESLYGWYITAGAGTRTGPTSRVSFGTANAGDIYGVHKYWNGADWTIEWYRIRAGVTDVADSLTTASDASLGVLAGAFPNTGSLSLANVSA